jgi:hypothetical protein
MAAQYATQRLGMLMAIAAVIGLVIGLCVAAFIIFAF